METIEGVETIFGQVELMDVSGKIHFVDNSRSNQLVQSFIEE